MTFRAFLTLWTIKDDLIAGIGTYFYNPNQNYTVEIYVNDVLNLVQNGVSPFTGFHTIKLDTYVPIKEGDIFTVKIMSNMVPALTGTRQHFISGVSEYFYNGTWIDSASQNKVCVIKAFKSSTTPTLQSTMPEDPTSQLRS